VQEAKFEAQAINDLLSRIATSPEVLKEAKKQAFEEASQKLKDLVDREIGGTGKVRSWQEKYVGSKGGYAAVRPRAKQWTDPNGKGKKYAVGAVTNAITSGHRFPGQGVYGKSRKWVRATSSTAGKVHGLHFYEKAQGLAEAVAQEAAEQVVQALIAHLEG
jgi:hypothetical protein